MDQKIIREYNNQTYSVAEGAAIIKELDERTKSLNAELNSIDQIASFLLGFKNLKLKEQVIESGGNINSLALTGNVLIFTNENAQAILNGIKHDGYKEIKLINRSDYAIRLNSLDMNAADSEQIKLPTGLGNIGIEGTSMLIYSEIEQRWLMTDIFASKYRPEHRGLTSTQVEVVNQEAESETREITNIFAVEPARVTAHTKATINEAYPDAPVGFSVYCDLVGKKYIKYSATDWDEKPLNQLQ